MDHLKNTIEDLFGDIESAVNNQMTIESVEDIYSRYDDEFNERIQQEDTRITNFSVEEYDNIIKPVSDEYSKSEEVVEVFVQLAAFAITIIVTVVISVAPYIFKRHADAIENFFGKLKNRVKVKKNKITIKGINFTRLERRIKDMYKEKNLNKIFTEKYTWLETLFYKRKIIQRKKDMKIVNVSFDEFFAMEIRSIFQELYARYDMPYYNYIANKIIKKTWINGLTKEVEKENIDHIYKFFYFKPKSYQKEFVEMYRGLKKRMNLEGYILSFDQGLGKTFTGLMLSKLLNKEVLYIVCMNTMKNVWLNEIKEAVKVYKDTDSTAWKEIFVYGHKINNHFDPKDTKIVIINNESLDKISNYIIPDKDSMIIIDESQNFRYLGGSRVKSLLDLKDKTQCKDVLAMSGTPIKAKPNELVPILYMIDPLFDMNVAKIYNYCFNVDQTYAANIINERFGYIIHRKTKADVSKELNLPPKYDLEVRLTIKSPERYGVDTVKAEVLELFELKYSEKLVNLEDLREKYYLMVTKYSSGSEAETQKYLKYISRNVDPSKKRKYYHELTIKEFEEFAENKIIPNIKDPDELKEFRKITKQYVTMRKSAMGEAIGAILPKRRAEMYSTIIKENEDFIGDSIVQAKKKITIFSTMLPVVDSVCEVLDSMDIGYVKIIGGGDTKKRADDILKFKLDDSIDVLVGTSQTLGVGVTLTEASDMLIFGTPWRKTDYNQLCDRIHRIGQTDPVYVRNVLLQSHFKNLSDRMSEIMEWSGDMFSSYIEES